jgi:crotonobetainyl-CoA:carnitine CoA-transferase CaiB-like acyl-CoA transferase
MAGTALVAAVAMALRQRSRTGRGSQIEVAQRENLGMFVGEHLVDFSMNRQLRAPIGNRHPHLAPHNVYASAGDDRWVAIACETDEQFVALCALLGRPDLAIDPRYQTIPARKENERDLDPVIASWTAARGHHEAMHLLQRAGVPAGAALTIPELLADPQLRTRGAWSRQTHPDAGTWDVEAPPWRFSRTPGHARLPAPGFAEHNEYVFGALLGLSDAEVAELVAAGVTASQPDETLHA